MRWVIPSQLLLVKSLGQYQPVCHTAPQMLVSIMYHTFFHISNLHLTNLYHDILTLAGNVATFVQLEAFWKLIQKVFAQSDGAKDEWYKVTGIPFPTHSNIRWYSKYDVLEVFFKYFPDLLTVMTNGEISTHALKFCLYFLTDTLFNSYHSCC